MDNSKVIKGRNIIKAFYYDVGNFGDILTPYLIKKLFNINIEHCNSSHDCNFIGVGSLLEHLFIATDDVDIWGAGFIRDGENFTPKEQKFLAVRGKLSANRILSNDNILMGDPGLLIEKISSPVQKEYKIGFIPHYIDWQNQITKKIKDINNIHYISIVQNPDTFIEDVAKCDYIISSSLHGIITADSLRIPNLHIQISDNVIGNNYKFEDYYSAFNQEHPFIDLRKLESEKITPQYFINAIDNIFQSKTNLEEIKEGLIGTLKNYIKEYNIQ